MAEFTGHLRYQGTDMGWMESAACAGIGTDMFFPESDNQNSYVALDQAKEVCSRCPVRADCLEYAIQHRMKIGIWGGMSGRALRRLVWERDKQEVHSGHRGRRSASESQ